MNVDQLLGTVRILIPTLLLWLLPRLTSDQASSIANAIMDAITALAVLGSVVWTLVRHTDANNIRAVTEIHPGVTVQIPPSVSRNNDAIHSMVNDPATPQVECKDPALRSSPG
jgi:hypothetical protein